jgi:hypothetical protein
MDPVNLAYPVEQRIDLSQIPPALSFLWHLVIHHPVVSAIVVGAWALYSVWAYKWSKRQPHEPKDERATLRGTAQVLSFKKTRGEAWNAGYLFLPAYMVREPRKTRRYLCIIKLAVQIPGREQCVTVVRKLLGPAERAAAQPGKIVQVRVDPNDDPKNVRIDFNQPITGPHQLSA